MQYTAQYGIETEEEYPYLGQQGNCDFQPAEAIFVNSDCNCVQNKSMIQLQAAVTQQPVSIVVEANQLAWQFYGGGVVQKNCGVTIDHAVLAVGWAVEKGINSWIVKNSWGPKWGNEGYIYISQDDTQNDGYGVCGVYFAPMVPTNLTSSH
jgi:C1A family cysteine protease